MASGAVSEILEDKGYRVETCADGYAALRRLAGNRKYDLLLTDDELSGGRGIELVRRARELPHRRRMRIIMLSTSDCEAEAWSAGTDAFLRKPDEMGILLQTIARPLKPK